MGAEGERQREENGARSSLPGQIPVRHLRAVPETLSVSVWTGSAAGVYSTYSSPLSETQH